MLSNRWDWTWSLLVNLSSSLNMKLGDVRGVASIKGNFWTDRTSGASKVPNSGCPPMYSWVLFIFPVSAVRYGAACSLIFVRSGCRGCKCQRKPSARSWTRGFLMVFQVFQVFWWFQSLRIWILFVAVRHCATLWFGCFCQYCLSADEHSIRAWQALHVRIRHTAFPRMWHVQN